MKLPSKDRLQSGAKHDDSVFCDGDETLLAQNFFIQFAYDRTHINVRVPLLLQVLYENESPKLALKLEDFRAILGYYDRPTIALQFRRFRAI